MTVLVLNCGSSSIKYEVFDEPTSERAEDGLDGLVSLADGLVEGVGEDRGRHTGAVSIDDDRVRSETERPYEDHAAALDAITDHLQGHDLLDGLTAVGHRVVHGGEDFTRPTVLDDDVIATLEQLSPLAPLHNPPSLEGIRVARTLRPDLPHVAVFDTAFHGTLPAAAYRYAVPEAWYVEHRVRRYGFHGTSHDFVSRQAARVLGRPREDLKLITLHLGNGASACAIDRGRSVDTSMGLSPLEGLVMGTRSGDLDPSVVFHLIRGGLQPTAVETQLNRGSGLLGLAGDNDLRAVESAADAGDPSATLALDVMAHRLRKYVGAYLAVLGGLDALVFTGGIGEHSAAVRRAVVQPLGHLGLTLDDAANTACAAGEGPVSIGRGTPAVMVVATDEERMIAAETLRASG